MSEQNNNQRPNRELLCDMGYDESVVFENPDFDSAIIGVDTDGHVVYDFELMVQDMMEKDGLSYEDAVEFIEYNTIRSLPYVKQAPVIMYPLHD